MFKIGNVMNKCGGPHDVNSLEIRSKLSADNTVSIVSYVKVCEFT